VTDCAVVDLGLTGEEQTKWRRLWLHSHASHTSLHYIGGTMASSVTSGLCRRLANVSLHNNTLKSFRPSNVRTYSTIPILLSERRLPKVPTTVVPTAASPGWPPLLRGCWSMGCGWIERRTLTSSSQILLSSVSQETNAVPVAPVATAVTTTKSTYNAPQLVRTDDGRRVFAAFDMRKHPKLKPRIVKRRLDRMRTYIGQEKNIRHSPWRLNLICQMVAGLPLPEAVTQLEFCRKSRAPLVQKVLQRTANLADIRHGLQPSQLEVAECFATKGTPLKRIKTMGRGRFGHMERRHAHMRCVLREIDFPLRIYQAPSLNQKKKWFMLQQQAERDGARARAEREELERLEREAAAAASKKKT